MNTALFSFRTGCENCGEVNNFVAPHGVICGKKVIFIAECTDCGGYQVLDMHYEDFLALFCGGGDENH